VNEKVLRAAKIFEVAQRNGFQNVGDQQFTSRSIYDTIAAGAGPVLRFFQDFANKTIYQANIQKSRLDSAEMITIDEVVIQGTVADFQAGCLLTVSVAGEVVIDRLNFKYDAVGAGFSTYPVKAVASDRFSVPMRTGIVIPPEVDFEFMIELVPGSDLTTPATLCLNGVGTLLKAQSSF
jgi:hypothetical protein